MRDGKSYDPPSQEGLDQNIEKDIPPTQNLNENTFKKEGSKNKETTNQEEAYIVQGERKI